MKKVFNKEQFVAAVKESFSIRETIRKLNLVVGGANYRTVHSKVKLWNLDTSHWLGKSHARGQKKEPRNKYKLEEILTTNSIYMGGSSGLKNRLIKEGYFKYECSLCGIFRWKEEYLSLHMDHINGIHDDNRIENLRLLCPNCHSQTSTYCGKNNLTVPLKLCSNCNIPIKPNSQTCAKCRTKLATFSSNKRCVDCNKYISLKSTRCKSCAVKLTPQCKLKIVWPSKEELLTMLKTSNYTQLSKKLGVSDNAIRKYLRK